MEVSYQQQMHIQQQQTEMLSDASAAATESTAVNEQSDAYDATARATKQSINDLT
ncbi:hypothetical protein P5673_010737 [Acropora cervicornis]|uniref:Uncharacterized protein n=1 Tax=Acropora cervicornis TaxID=6130 RepID=A0AAD9V8Y7_ACRCE|nr:hypothetical protein P5673_010737 [Acropora cervicornis]